MALGSLLLQRHYVRLYTNEKWENIRIPRTEAGKPHYERLEFNVSHDGGLVILVGYNIPVGADIIQRNSTTFSGCDWSDVYSVREMKFLADCVGSEFNDACSIMWALKESYMKCIGCPDWEQLKTIEFLNIRMPQINGYVIQAVDNVIIHSFRQQPYIELHDVDGTHFIAVYTSKAPISEIAVFERLRLNDIVDGLDVNG